MHSALTLRVKPHALPPAKPKAKKYASGGSTTTSIATNIPVEGQQAYANLIADTSALTDTAANPYVPYQGEREAAFTPLQKEGFAGIDKLGVSQATKDAAGIAKLAADKAGKTTYKPTAATAGKAPTAVKASAAPANVKAPGAALQTKTQSFTGTGTADKYMNPYMQQVVANQQRDAIRADDVARGSRNAAAVGAGAFGGSRQAIQEAEAAKNLSTQLGDIQAAGSNAAYQQAMAQFNAEQALGLSSQTANQQAGLTTAGQGLQAGIANQNATLASGAQNLQAGIANQNAGLQYNAQGLTAQQLTEASKQYGAGLGLQGLQAAMSGAQTLSGIGDATFKQDYTSGTGKIAAGGIQQDQVQKGMDNDYNDYLKQQQYPYEQASFMSDILHGAQGAVQSKTTNATVEQPSNMQNLIGLGTTIYGMGKAKGGSIGYAAGGYLDSTEDNGALYTGGIAAIAPANVGEFADGGIVGYADGGETYPEVSDKYRERPRLERFPTAGDIMGDTLYMADEDAPVLVPPGAMNAPRVPRNDGAIDAGAFTAPPDAAGGPGGGGIPMPQGLSIAELRRMRTEAGVDPARFKKEGIAALDEVAKAEQDAVEADKAEMDKLHAAAGIAGLEREKKLNARRAEMDDRGKKLEGDSWVQAGLSILTADPGRGWLAAVAAGSKHGFDYLRENEAKLRTEKAALDDSMDDLLEIRRKEAMAQGREKAALNSLGHAKTVEAKKIMATFMNSAGLTEMKMDNDLFAAAVAERRDARNRATQLGIAGLRTAGGAGARPLTPGTPQWDMAVRARMKELLKDPSYMTKGPAAAQAEAIRQINAAAHGESAPAAAGWAGMTVTDD